MAIWNKVEVRNLKMVSMPLSSIKVFKILLESLFLPTIRKKLLQAILHNAAIWFAKCVIFMNKLADLFD